MQSAARSTLWSILDRQALKLIRARKARAGDEGEVEITMSQKKDPIDTIWVHFQSFSCAVRGFVCVGLGAWQWSHPRFDSALHVCVVCLLYLYEYMYV